MVFSSNRDRANHDDTAVNTLSKRNARSPLVIAEKDRRVPLMAHLDQLAEALSRSLLEGGQRLSLSVIPLNAALPYGEVIPIGLILNELVTNTVKSATDDSPQATIAISFEMAGPCWRLAVSANQQENIDPEARLAEMNSSIVRSLARKLDARVACSCTIPGDFTVNVTRGQFDDPGGRQ